MRGRTWRTVALAVALVSAAGGAGGQSGQQRPVAVASPADTPPALRAGPLPRSLSIPPQALETFIDGVVRDAMEADHVAGVTVSVVQDGRVALSKGYGVADLDPVRPVDPERTLFRVASISKTFTWLLMAQQIEAGRYTIDTPINDLLPPELLIPDQGYEEPIRVRHLLTHSAGFEDKALGHLFEDEPEAIRPRNVYLAEERPRRVRPVGRLATYSNYGVGLAGAIVEKVGGQPYEVLLSQRLLTPLGMAHTTVREAYPAREGLPAPMSPVLAAERSRSFVPAAGAYEAKNFEYITHAGPVGGISTTAGDMARYMRTILNDGSLDGVSVFGPGTAQRLRMPLLRPAPGMNGWRFGFNEYALPGGYGGLGHGGATSYFFSDMVLVPDLRLGMFISTNTASGNRLATSLAHQVVGRFYAQPRVGPRPGDPKLKDQGEAYAGDWLTTRRPYSGLEKFVFTVAGATPVSVTDQGRLLIGGPRPSQWVPAGGPGRFVRADGEEVMAFEMVDGRAVRGFTPWGGAALDRAPFHRTPGALGLFAALAVVAAVLALVGPLLRLGRDVRGTGAQTLANGLLLAASAAWLLAVAFFAAWAGAALETEAAALYDWPGGVGIGSWFALVAALLTLVLVGLLLAVWRRADRRSWGWSVWRKGRHTLAVLAFAAFAVVLAVNGGLEPWSG